MDIETAYRKTGLSWGSGDLFMLGRQAPEAIGQHAAVLCFISAEARPAFDRVMVVASPPRDEAFFMRLKAGFTVHVSAKSEGRISALEAEEIFHRRVDVVVAKSLESPSVTEIVATAGFHSAVIVLDAALYRDADVAVELEKVGESRPFGGLPWPLHLYRTVVAALAAAKRSETFLAIWSGELMPPEEAVRKLLLSIEGCGLFIDAENGAPTLSASRYQEWLEMARCGKLGDAINQLDAADEVSGVQALLVRIRLLRAARLTGHVRAALEAVREELHALPPENAVAIAEAAVFASVSDLPAALLNDAIPSLTSLETLEVALSLANQIYNNDLAMRAATRLAELYPSSRALRQHRAVQKAEVGDFRGAIAVLKDVNTEEARDLVKLWNLIVDHEGDEGLRDPRDFVSAVATDLPHRRVEAVQLGVEVLERAARYSDALDLCVALPPGEKPLQPELALTALRLIQNAQLRAHGGLAGESVLEAMRRIVHSMALHPDNAKLRVRLVGLLSPQSLGSTAVAVLASVLFELASHPLEIDSQQSFSLRAPKWKETELKELVARGANWLSRHQPYVPGTLTFPQELIQMPADVALAGLVDLTIHIASNVQEQGREALMLVLSLAIAIAPHSSEADEDILLIRAAGSQAARTGEVQLARDLAEQALALVANAPPQRQNTRARWAWLGYADIFAHLGNAEEAIVALAGTLAIRTPRRWDDVLYETSTAIRVLRDWGLHELARPLIATVRRATAELGLAERYATRADFLELQLDVVAMTSDERRNPPTLEKLLRRASDQLRHALVEGDDLAPSASVLASLVAVASAAGVACEPEALELLRGASATLPGAAGAVVAMSQKTAPTLDELEAYAKRVQSPRYSEDLGYDLRIAAAFARRLLGAESSPAGALYAMELLADQTVRLPGVQSGAAANRHLVRSAAATFDALKEASEGGLSVVMLGTGNRDSGGLLRRIVATSGAIGGPITEPADVFSTQALERWRETFPYGYGDSRELNVFYTSTAGIGLTEIPQRAVVVASTDLQAFPVNLLNVGGTLAGWDRRLGAAPSLTWLLASRRNPFVGEGRVAAWIPADEPSEGLPSLAPLATDLAPALLEYGGSLEIGVEVSPTLEGADLAIVAAHGGVGEGARFFRVVQDDVGVAIGAGSFARRFAGTGIAVLFICSSGRIDPHPRASTVLGLAKQLLDAGCRTVIAPPWPLSVVVPRFWLPVFLEKWASGLPAIDATYEANVAVRTRLGSNPAESLAMTLYGDPLTARTAASQAAAEGLESLSQPA